MRKYLLFLLLISTMTMAQQPPVLLFPDGAPGEKTQLTQNDDWSGNHVAGKPVLRMGDISAPTLTFYPAPADNNSGATIIVCPGGGYNILAYDLEGTEICEWFNQRGVNCVLLKYRVPRREGLEKHEAPLQDLQRTMAYTRSHANEWGIDANRIGVLGFSAGAHLAAVAGNAYGQLTYPKIDDCDDSNLRPDFCVLIYPAYLDGENFQISPELQVTEHTPPTFLVQTQDDSRLLNSSIFYYYALKEANVPVSMNLYPTGGHGYGLRDSGEWVNEWPERVLRWLGEMDIISKKISPK